MKERGERERDLLNAGRLLNSVEVLYLLDISSHTTLIKMEKDGEIKVARRVGNRKRYNPTHIKRVLGL